MTVPELEAAIGWLERNRRAEHLPVLDGDPRYAWAARKRREWTPPVGRSAAPPRRVRGAAEPGDLDGGARAGLRLRASRASRRQFRHHGFRGRGGLAPQAAT